MHPGAVPQPEVRRRLLRRAGPGLPHVHRARSRPRRRAAAPRATGGGRRPRPGDDAPRRPPPHLGLAQLQRREPLPDDLDEAGRTGPSRRALVRRDRRHGAPARVEHSQATGVPLPRRRRPPGEGRALPLRPAGPGEPPRQADLRLPVVRGGVCGGARRLGLGAARRDAGAAARAGHAAPRHRRPHPPGPTAHRAAPRHAARPHADDPPTLGRDAGAARASLDASVVAPSGRLRSASRPLPRSPRHGSSRRCRSTASGRESCEPSPWRAPSSSRLVGRPTREARRPPGSG